MDAGSDAVDAATDATAETATEAADDAAPSLTELFSADGFDYDAAVEAVEASEMGALSKGAALRALEGARDNPALLQTALEQVRGLMGL